MIIYDDEFVFRDTDYHLRAYVDPTGVESPILITFEPNDNRGRPLAEVRIPLAQNLSDSLGLTPDKVRYFEQKPDGSLTQYHFRPYEQTIRTYGDDMQNEEVERAERAGHLRPERIVRYNAIPEAASRTAIEDIVQQSLDVPISYIDRQNQELEETRLPSRDPYVEEAAQRMSKAHAAQQEWQAKHKLIIKNEPKL